MPQITRLSCNYKRDQCYEWRDWWGTQRAWVPSCCSWELRPGQQPHLPELPFTHISLDLAGLRAEEWEDWSLLIFVHAHRLLAREGWITNSLSPWTGVMLCLTLPHTNRDPAKSLGWNVTWFPPWLPHKTFLRTSANAGWAYNECSIIDWYGHWATS